MRVRSYALVAAIAACGTLACTPAPAASQPPPPRANDRGHRPASEVVHQDTQPQPTLESIAALKHDARALVHVEGCTAADMCTAIAFGVKSCGGPEDFLVYCPRTTDVTALKQKLEALARAERAYYELHHISSTCEYRTPPSTGLVERTCRVVPPPPTRSH